MVPFKLKKKKKPTRKGFIYIVKRVDEAFLLERRPAKGLLGGMLGWPTSEWSADPNDIPPVDANWQMTDSHIRHTFTHFHLDVIVKFANVPVSCKPKQGFFIGENEFDLSSLPTLFQKAYKLENPFK